MSYEFQVSIPFMIMYEENKNIYITFFCPFCSQNLLSVKWDEFLFGIVHSTSQDTNNIYNIDFPCSIYLNMFTTKWFHIEPSTDGIVC